jgi:hypothetical protein
MRGLWAAGRDAEREVLFSSRVEWSARKNRDLWDVENGHEECTWRVDVKPSWTGRVDMENGREKWT